MKIVRTIITTIVIVILSMFTGIFLISALIKFNHWCNWFFDLIPKADYEL